MPDPGRKPSGVPPLMVDLYELTMAQAYLAEGMDGTATFSLFARSLPRDHGYFVSAGLETVLDYLERLEFGPDDLAYLAGTGIFDSKLLDRLGGFRFSGSVRALPEGTIFFPQEPLLEVTAPILEAQIVETAIVNLMHFQTIVASKASRCLEAAAGRQLVEFGLRRIHGTDAALKVAWCCALVGFQSTSNVHAGQVYGIPIAGTMAHSFVQSFSDELASFRAFARTFPDRCVLLIDTYDTLEGARRAIQVGQEMQRAGHALRGVRLDSGDLLTLSRQVRPMLDEAGLTDTIIFASGGLDELEIADLLAAGAPIDAFGVGTKLGVAADAPYLDMAYKLVAYEGRPTMKLSSGKVTWPGPKQVWRQRAGGKMAGDVLATEHESAPAEHEPLLELVMDRGRRLQPRESWTRALARFNSQRAALSPGYRRLSAPDDYPVTVSETLQSLRQRLSAEIEAREELSR